LAKIGTLASKPPDFHLIIYNNLHNLGWETSFRTIPKHFARGSNDKPFSESQFKTLKYRPEFPARFGSLQDSREFGRQFFPWYNTEHRHHGIALLTPELLHYGQAAAVIEARQEVLNAAYAAHPERFVRKPPAALPLPEAVWINPPQKEVQSESLLQ
jgi:hypothetical protein